MRWLSLKACGAAGAGCSWGAAGLRVQKYLLERIQQPLYLLHIFWILLMVCKSFDVLVRVSLLTRTDMAPRLLFVCGPRPRHLAAGLVAGVLLGGVAAVPARTWPGFEALMQCSAKMPLLFLFQRSSTRRLTLSLRADHDLISFPLASLVKIQCFWPSKQLTWAACCCTTGCNAWIWCHVWTSQAKS